MIPQFHLRDALKAARKKATETYGEYGREP